MTTVSSVINTLQVMEFLKHDLISVDTASLGSFGHGASLGVHLPVAAEWLVDLGKSSCYLKTEQYQTAVTRAATSGAEFIELDKKYTEAHKLAKDAQDDRIFRIRWAARTGQPVKQMDPPIEQQIEEAEAALVKVAVAHANAENQARGWYCLFQTPTLLRA
mgnify:CR=1 FL=1